MTKRLASSALMLLTLSVLCHAKVSDKADRYFTKHKNDSTKMEFSIPPDRLSELVLGGDFVSQYSDGSPYPPFHPSKVDDAIDIEADVRVGDPNCRLYLDSMPKRGTSATIACFMSLSSRKAEQYWEKKFLDFIAERVALNPNTASDVPPECPLREEMRARQEDDAADFKRGLEIGAASQDLPEEVHRFEVQAKAAVKDGDLKKAAIRYAQGLAIAPWWPEGRYNHALILGKLACHEEAILQMKRYLQLAPKSADGRKAKDKIYEWEDKLDVRPQ